jgi:hypothetical protein
MAGRPAPVRNVGGRRDTDLVTSTTPRARGPGDVLGPRALNRALLERQLLLRRAERGALATIEHLVGMQAQAPQAPYIGLWTRLLDFRPDQLAERLVDRGAVRIALQRGTVHLVSADDCLALRPLLQPLYDRVIAPNGPYRRALADVDLTEFRAAAKDLVEERPRTNTELRALLGGRWPGLGGEALTNTVRSLLACVQVPPRGVWGASGQARVTTAQAWLGRPLATASPAGADRLVLRYLAAFGPAGVKDAQIWCGLTRLGEVFERLRPGLRVFRDEGGAKLYDLPDAPRPDPDTPAPVRFLPAYDNLLRSHADRTRVMSARARELLTTKNDTPRPTFLVDGFLRGIWRLERGGSGRRAPVTLLVTPFEPLTDDEAAAVIAEASLLLEFAAGAAETSGVRIAPPLEPGLAGSRGVRQDVG